MSDSELLKEEVKSIIYNHFLKMHEALASKNPADAEKALNDTKQQLQEVGIEIDGLTSGININDRFGSSRR